MSRLARLRRFIGAVVTAARRDQLMVRAAALAYATLFSLVPLLTVALATVARVQPERAELVVRAMAAILPFSPVRVRMTLTELAERAAGLGWVAILFSALVTLYAFYQIEEAVNSIWGLPQRRQWQWRLASLVALLLTGPLLVAALFSGLYWLSNHAWYAAVSPLTRPLPLLFAVAVLTLLYRWVPHTKVPWRAAGVGAAIASISLAAIHLGFQEYVRAASQLNVVYGSLSILLFFLGSLYLFWLAILLGAEGSWVAGHEAPQARAGAVGAALRLLAALADEGSLPHGRVAAILGSDLPFVLARLSGDPPIISRSARCWRLARSPEAITTSEVRTRLLTEDDLESSQSGDAHTIASLAKERDGE